MEENHALRFLCTETDLVDDKEDPLRRRSKLDEFFRWGDMVGKQA